MSTFLVEYYNTNAGAWYVLYKSIKAMTSVGAEMKARRISDCGDVELRAWDISCCDGGIRL